MTIGKKGMKQLLSGSEVSSFLKGFLCKHFTCFSYVKSLNPYSDIIIIKLYLIAHKYMSPESMSLPWEGLSKENLIDSSFSLVERSLIRELFLLAYPDMQPSFSVH